MEQYNFCPADLRASSYSSRASIIIVGPSGAGKSTLARALGKRTGLPIVEIGFYVKAEARVNTPDLEPINYADKLFAAGRYLHFVESLAKANLLGAPAIVVGPRLPQELRFVREVVRYSISVGLSVPAGVREKRRPDLCVSCPDDRTWLSYRDEIEFGWGVHRTSKQVDILLDGQAPVQLLANVAWEEWVKFKLINHRPRIYVPNEGLSQSSSLVSVR